MIDALRNFSIDKSDWTPVRFGDVVYEPKESVKDAAKAGIKHVVGLEHIDSEDIHLRRSASIEESTTFTRKFDTGDVLFGRRRAYLKKAARAEFSGICSGDIIVMRAEENLLPELLPFIVNNDKFFDFAIKHSAGGLSPRVKFKNLANYEFQLPPKNIQAKLAKLLWSKIEVQEKYLSLIERLETVYQSKKSNFFKNANDTYKKVTLGDLVEIKSGDSPSNFTFVAQEDGLPFYKVKDLNNSIKYQNFAKEWVQKEDKKVIPAGSVIFPKRGAAIMTNKVRITSEDCHVDTNTMSLKVLDKNILFNEFLFYLLIYRGLYKIADTAQIPQINNLHIHPYIISLPPIQNQITLVKGLDKIVANLQSVQNNLTKTKSMLDSMLREIF